MIHEQIFTKGEIYFGRKGSDAKHPIIYLEEKNEDFFIGAMITKSSKYPNNIKMKIEHFKEKDAEGKLFELYYNDSKLVKARLIKKNEWKHFRKIGELTEEGIAFVENNILLSEEKLWEEIDKY